MDLDGVRTRCYMFAFRLSSSGKSVHRVYLTCAQEAFLEGHIEAFNAIGGVPTKHIRYDNLTSAVSKVVYGAGRQRVENERWVLFKSHFGFDAFYCEPGTAVAAVDQACRRLRLPTIRAVLDEALSVAGKEQLSYQGFLAELLLAECDDRDRRSSVRRVKSAGFPRDKWLGDFDFEANTNINPATITPSPAGIGSAKASPCA
ncbi:hypothetical protein GCM10023346_40860 [Arthrobacter gyeryongensis]|uniref:IstB-like ATP-binding domain-containing protein n=1 Tax=Arthrobacter gyeryongensis TaxID=1650592 RepID=A0ABP9SNZ0_9MICC